MLFGYTKRQAFYISLCAHQILLFGKDLKVINIAENLPVSVILHERTIIHSSELDFRNFD